jgi:DNA-binding MarR family transcriptional regulator
MSNEMIVLKLYECAAAIGLNSKILTYRPDGKKLQSCMLKICSNENIINSVNLDFTEIEVCDVSFIDEIIFEFSATLRKKSAGTIIYLSNLDEYVYDSLRAAQLLKEDKLSKKLNEKVRLPLLYFRKSRGFEIIGEMEAVLMETFAMLDSKGKISARDIALKKGIAINSASNRLKKLFDYGLIQRETITDTSGVYYQYLLPKDF